MYDARSGILVRLLVGVCVFVWCITFYEIANAYDTINPDPTNTNLGANSFISAGTGYYKILTVGPETTTGTQYTSPRYSSFVIKNASGSTISISTQTTGVSFVKNRAVHLANGKYQTWNTAGTCVYWSEPLNLANDSDGDGLYDDRDPCPDSKDSGSHVSISQNRCTGEWYSMVISGSCEPDFNAKTGYKTYFNTSLSAAARQTGVDQAKATGCYSTASKYFTPQSLQAWWNKVDANSNSTSSIGAQPGEEVGQEDVVNLSPISTVPSEASDDPDMNVVLKQIDRLQSSISSDVAKMTENIGAKVEGSAGKIVNAINGISLTGVSNAIGTASGTAHGDSAALLAAVNAMAGKLDGGSNSSTSVNFEGLDLEQLQTENDRLYSTEGGIGLETSLPNASNSIVTALSNWITTLRSRIMSLLPDSSVVLVSPTPCLSYGGSITDASGRVFPIEDFCFDIYAEYFELVGNALLGFVSIMSFLNCFGAVKD